MSDPAEQLRAVLAARPDLTSVVVEQLEALGYVVTRPERVVAGEPGEDTGQVPFVAIGAGERAPWADEPLSCPTCGTGPLALHESTSDSGGGITLRYISHCGQSWMRGEVDL